MTFVAETLGRPSLTKQALMVLGGSLLIAICAQISVPMWPVNMTLQTLAVLIVGLTFGARLGVLTVAAYLTEGAMGLPVFTNANNGAAFFGPTAGFLVGFLLMVWVAGTAADRGLARSVGGAVVAALLASVLLYIPGLAWPLGVAQIMGFEAGWAALSFDRVIAGFMAPFLVGDVAKALIAALVVSGGFAALRR